MARKIKGIKVNDEQFELDLSRIGSYVHDTAVTEDTELVSYINSHGGGGGGTTATTVELKSVDGTEFELKVYDDGTLYADEKVKGAITPDPNRGTTPLTKLGSDVAKLYINSFYCGGADADEHTLNYCSHNFVELSNLTGADINLDGMSLQYLKGGSTAWIQEDVIPLSGVIKKDSTFLIRCAQCSNIDGAKIVVDDYDMECPNVKFDIASPSFYLCFGTTAHTGDTNPYWVVGTTPKVEPRFIDLIGVTTVEATCNAFAGIKGAYAYNKANLNNVLMRRYYALDGCKQGTKAISAMENTTEWCYVDLTKDDGDLIPSIEANTPKARIDKKNLYFDKTKLLTNKPSIITCSFGIEAVDNEEGSGATRCFNWVSKGRHDEFIWIREKGTTEWGDAHESFKAGSLDPEYTRYNNQHPDYPDLARYYNRVSVAYADGVVFTAHKYIKHGLVAGTYEYIAGRANRKGEPILNECTDVREFKVRTYNDVKNSFKYVQTTDQQGFNWNEYRIWEAAGETIAREARSNDTHFMVNTGDMAQSGSRMNEWLDYFDGKGVFLNNMEEMATVGNNDLSGKLPYTIPDGEDASKLSLANFNYFYTYEIDVKNPPVFTVPVGSTIEESTNVAFFIPSLYSFNYGDTHFMCMNSEIKASAEHSKDPTYPAVYDCPTTGNFYPQIKEWCERDIEENSSKWNIAYCHELPFHLMVTGDTANIPATIGKEIYNGTGGDGRLGANMNVNIQKYKENEGTECYWFSEFCQTHNIKLVMGGHKHTQATTWPLLENVKYIDGERTVYSWRPIIVLSDVSDFDSQASGLTEATVTLGGVTGAGSTFIAKYPDTWVEEVSGETFVKSTFTGVAALCEFELESELSADTTAVVYAMSQATSYKHTSNRELPSEKTPWSRYKYGVAETTGDLVANPGQKYPFYTIWSVETDTSVCGEVRKVVGAFAGSAGNSNGKFDINKDGQYVLNGKCATVGEHDKPFYSINGLSDGVAAESEAKIIILK